jgi:hypothetical protein
MGSRQLSAKMPNRASSAVGEPYHLDANFGRQEKLLLAEARA